MLSCTGRRCRRRIGWAGAAMLASSVTTLAADKTVDVFQDNGVYLMRELSSNRIIYDQRKLGMYDTRKDASYLEPQVEVVPRPDGADFVYTYHNDDSQDRRLADLRLGTLVLEDDIHYLDVRSFCQQYQGSHEKRPAPTYTYPGTMYAPVFILSDKHGTFGVSLQYPVLEYAHDVNFRVRSAPVPKSEGATRGWVVDVRMSLKPEDDSGGGNINYPALIAPGETRTYVLSARYTHDNDNWMQTLVPYRDYFRSIYGGVQYHRESNAIKGVTTGMTAETTADNPYGYSPEKVRPDLYGFGPWIDMMLGRGDWPEMMIVKPTGNYHVAKDWNFPFIFMSRLLVTPELDTAFDPDIGIASIPNRGVKLGLWWGRSLQVAYEWEPSDCHPLDPDNPADVAAAFKELDLAAAAGARTVGLDTYSHRVVPIWRSYKWMRAMRARQPGVKFIVEPFATDIMHTLAGMWMRGWDESPTVDSPEDVLRLRNPHYLADFLLPGHESWGAIRYSYVLARFGVEVSQDQAMQDLAFYASLGYRPELFGNYDLTVPVQAAESWLTTVPEHLQIPRDQWVLFRDPYDPNAESDIPPPDGDESGDGSDGSSGDGSDGSSGDGSGDSSSDGGIKSHADGRGRNQSRSSGGGNNHAPLTPSIGSLNGGNVRISKPGFDSDEVAEALRKARDRKGDRTERP